MFGRRPRYHRGYGGGYGRGHGAQNLALLLLASQLFQVGFSRIPPVTLISILGQVAIFLKLIPLKHGWPSVRDICISSDHILKAGEYKRLLTSCFFHLDEWHLYYNMVSFLWKGRMLERKYGSPYFAYLLGVFSVLTSLVTVGLGVVASECAGDASYRMQCAAGFSGVIFALKVITTHESQGSEHVFGIPVPGPLVCWAELLVIQIIAPQSSFIGHLSGIIVGLLYVKGPLKTMMDQLVPSQPSYTYQSGPTNEPTSSTRSGNRPSYTYRSGATGGRSSNGGDTGASGYSGRPRDNGAQYQAYTGGMSEDEQLRKAMEESRRSCETGPPRTAPPPYTVPPYTSPTVPARPPAPPSATPSAPPYIPQAPPPSYEETTKNRIYPDLSEADSDNSAPRNSRQSDSQEEVRRRRLARFT